MGPATGWSCDILHKSHDSHVNINVHIYYVQKEDPFWEPTDVDVQIGSVHVYLQSLTYMVKGDVMVM